MDTQKKLYLAVALLAVMGGAVYMQNKKQQADAQSHSIEGAQAQLPQLDISEESQKKITKVVIRQGEKKAEDKKEGEEAEAEASTGERQEFTLERQGEEWMLTKPMSAKANASNVTSMLDNLRKLKFSEQISSATDSYAEWGVSDDKAMHAVFYEGDKVVADLYFGDSGSRGQMTRMAGKDGVYAVKNFSKWVFDRDAKGWRDRTVLKFEDTDVAKVSIQNEHGSFDFVKNADKWSGTYKPAKGGGGGAIPDFKEESFTSLIAAYKSLSAVDFGTGKTLAETGLEKPTAMVTFELKDGAKKQVAIGSAAEGTNRWAKVGGNDEIFSISSWSAEWVTSNFDKFQNKKDAKKDMEKEDEGEDVMPVGMPGMPPGH